ncbi:uncharacterized protein LOC133034453 [Cannabis sativa]|uniref:uncharacterized protein LOC133034453 n=1 Tax=Cannabis sativa TaxID=3483 RepID=UPI0029C9CF73|nr:uncharacterized protein LOC133034453 [Cannabis sativa]
MKVDHLSRVLGFEGCFVVEYQGRSGGLAMLWKNQEKVSVDTFSENHIDCKVSFEGQREFRFTGVYGEPNRSLIRKTWDLLTTLLSRSTLPWCLMGDFNNVLNQSEKVGGQPYPVWLIEGFQEAILLCGLRDMEMHGHPFTWEKSRDSPSWIGARLDRALVNNDWLSIFPTAQLTNLESSPSDHSPLLLELLMGTRYKSRRDDEGKQLFYDAKKELFAVLNQRETFWKQRSKQLWLKEGDQNSKFFHSKASTRRRNNHISCLKDDDGILRHWDSGLDNVIVDFYSKLFTAEPTRWEDVLDCVTPTFCEEHNDFFASVDWR